ncbi:hypothetical protein [Ferruginibacter sp.]|nr:hypothetical protein [Ferruginibacter sp.]
MLKIILPVFAGMFLVTSCNTSVPCANQYITPAFIGFKLSDLDSITVRRFKKDGAFLQLIDTATISLDTNFLKSTSTNDTTFVKLNSISGQEKYVFPDHDWQIYIPAKNMTFSISNIISPQTESSCFKCSCWNPINSFVQNSQTLIPQLRKIPSLGGDFYITYIRR